MRTRNTVPAIVGLLVAWGGTALLVSPVAWSARHTAPIVTSLLAEVALYLLCGLVVGIVLFWEKKPLASLWLRPFSFQSFFWAGVLLLVYFILIFPATEFVRRDLGLRGYAPGMESVLVLPLWLRIVAVITAGVVEEILFRGYAVTRLANLTGSMALAVVVSTVIFAALHLPVWGAGPSVAFSIGGLATTAF